MAYHGGRSARGQLVNEFRKRQVISNDQIAACMRSVDRRNYCMNERGCYDDRPQRALIATVHSLHILRAFCAFYASSLNRRRSKCHAILVVVGLGWGITISAPHMHAKALEILSSHLQPGCCVLDVGSGSGYLSVAMAQLVGPSGKAVGIDHIPSWSSGLGKMCAVTANTHNWIAVAWSCMCGMGLLATKRPLRTMPSTLVLPQRPSRTR